MTSQELIEAARAYAKEVEARTDITLSTKNTYLVHVNRFVEWYRIRNWNDGHTPTPVDPTPRTGRAGR